MSPVEPTRDDRWPDDGSEKWRAGHESIPGTGFCLPVPVSGWNRLAAGKLEYNRDIRPILAENCFACHGPDSAARKADLRLDRREAAIEAGAIAPGDPRRAS